ncbi:unnamed protein product [Durusdinium trenchii]|uniref:TIR domain-containing protein n=2 Tax=Durusdinium trenchii TaxID=1381693 RepID=A0ABP0PYG0_9DINO
MAILGLAFAAASSVWITVRLAQGGEVDHLDLTISWTISVTGIVLLVSAPLPDDATLTRLASLGVATLCGFFTSYEAVDAVKHLKMFAEAQCWQRPNVITFEDRRMSQGICIWYLCLCVWNVSWNVLNMGLFLSTAFQRSAYTMQDRMWRFLTLFFQVNVFVDVVQILFDTVALHRLNTGCFFLIGDLTGLCLTCYGGVPKRLHELLRRYFEATERTAAAAGIASLVGNCAVQEALDQATSRFRVINVDKIQLSDLGSNQPSAELFERSVPASLGSCDAFISHSWSDDPGAKWAALISWRDRFVSSRGRSPYVWFDKACIDQSDIEANLRILPVFLSGCSSLLVLCGSSFLSRLWCVLELFTFVHMGGKTYDIDCISLLLPGQEESDWNAIHVFCSQFDVRNCDCSVQADKEKILSIIQTGFGDMDHFNHAVRRVMRRIDGLSSHQFLFTSSDSSSSSSSELSDSDSETELSPYMED